MSKITFTKAKREQLRAKIAIVGASGHGKTGLALTLAYGLVGDWDKIGVADTEYDSSKIYIGTDLLGFEVGEFLHAPIEDPYTPDKFVAAIEAAEEAGLKALIIDSFTHEWDGVGGISDWHAELGGEFRHWKEPKKVHKRLLDRIQKSDLHIICTVRAKQEYQLVPNDRGKLEPMKVGMKPVQSNDYDYLFTTVFWVTGEHEVITDKDRTGLFSGWKGKLTLEHVQDLKAWLEKGEPIKPLKERAEEALKLLQELRKKSPEVAALIEKKEAKLRLEITKWPQQTLIDAAEYIKKEYAAVFTNHNPAA